MKRRTLLLSSVACIHGGAFAQAVAERPITLVVPFAAGGGVDSTARLVAQKLAEQLRQPVVVDNVPGASGTIGTLKVARSAPDGLTLLFTVNSSITVAPLIAPSSVRYNAAKDLVAVTTTGFGPLVFVGKAALPPTLSGLVALAKAQPNKLTLGTDGVGTSLHLTAEVVKQRLGISTLHVPYKSGPQVLTDVAGGQIDLAVLPLTLAQPFIREGKVRGYGVTSRARWPSLPETPALSEVPELAGFDMEYWLGIFAPAGVSARVVETLAKAADAMTRDPEVMRKMSDIATRPAAVAGPSFTALLDRERAMFVDVIKAANIKVE
jgi:tripartite-type tricarboxylate transporter receptor subunit TctC